MDESQKKSTFDLLVAGLSADERNAMLSNLNQPGDEQIEIYDDPNLVDNFNGTLKARLNNESIFYRIYIWIRSLFSKTSIEKIYNDDVLLSLAKKINHEHPGIVNPNAQLLDSLFYSRLTALKTAADFFKPYMYIIDENQGPFYVFLSTFVTPELSDRVNHGADPYNLKDDVEPTQEIRSELLKKLDDVLKGIPSNLRNDMYNAVKSVQWLNQFCNLPFIHFTSQFTDIKDGVFTCPYNNAKVDFNSFAAVFDNHIMVPNEVLEAVFLFSQKKEFSKNYMYSDIENSVKKFMSVATSHFANIKMFLSVIPMTTMGKIIFQDYNWVPGSTGGGEDWYIKYRNQWRKVIETRWNEFVKDRKKTVLETGLERDFGLKSFPEMPSRPWSTLWGGIPFGYELTGGYLAWYCNELFNFDQEQLNTLMMEGIFLKSENRTEYSEALEAFIKAAGRMNDLLTKLEFKGEYANTFEEMENQSSRTFKAQSTIESLIAKLESDIKVISVDFCVAIKTIEAVFKGIFDDESDGVHGTLQNLNLMKGHDNMKFKDDLRNTRKNLQRTFYYLSELDPIDSPSGK